MGSRDALAKKHELRLIVPDKFGVGGTGNVPLEHRIDSWLGVFSPLLPNLEGRAERSLSPRFPTYIFVVQIWCQRCSDILVSSTWLLFATAMELSIFSTRFSTYGTSCIPQGLTSLYSLPGWIPPTQAVSPP